MFTKVLNHYKSMFDGKSQQPNMKMGDITELLISIPPLEEQIVIVEKANSLMALCDARKDLKRVYLELCKTQVFETKNPKLLIVKGLIVGPPGLEPGTT
ncbi:hypothetical protein N9J07_00455 [Bacteroidia bacterium]|nr:hypothetical protein [Bacteroidia bacterium]